MIMPMLAAIPIPCSPTIARNLLEFGDGRRDGRPCRLEQRERMVEVRKPLAPRLHTVANMLSVFANDGRESRPLLFAGRREAPHVECQRRDDVLDVGVWALTALPLRIGSPFSPSTAAILSMHVFASSNNVARSWSPLGFMKKM